MYNNNLLLHTSYRNDRTNLFPKYFYIPKIREAYCKEFSGTLISQDFCLPKPIINYLLKNTESPKVYQKLLESCKYFYSKKSYLVLKEIKNSYDEWNLKHLSDSTPESPDHNDLFKFDGFDIRNYDAEKIWIVETLFIGGSENTDIVSGIIPRIFRCDAKKLDFSDQTFFFKEFCFLIPKVQECIFSECTIQYDDFSEVPFEIIFESFSMICVFDYTFPVNARNFTNETMLKIVQHKNFENIEVFELEEIPTRFDIAFIYNEIKETKSCKKLMFDFCEGMPLNLQNQIVAINDEIFKEKNLDYIFPIFNFPEYDYNLNSKLRWRQYNEFQKHNHNCRKIEKKFHPSTATQVCSVLAALSFTVTLIAFWVSFLTYFSKKNNL